MRLPSWSTRQSNASPFPPGQIPLKVPNIKFDFDVSVDREHWRTVTSKSNSRPYNIVQMSIRSKVSMYCGLGVQLRQKRYIKVKFDVRHFQR